MYSILGWEGHSDKTINTKSANIDTKTLNFKINSMDDTKKMKDHDEKLNETIHTKQRILGTILGFPELITVYCSVCLLSIWNGKHKQGETAEGSVYKRFHCGKRGYKAENLQ